MIECQIVIVFIFMLNVIYFAYFVVVYVTVCCNSTVCWEESECHRFRCA